MGSKQFTQEQKLSVLQSAEKVGPKKAAELADVHYTTVYDWKRELEAKGKEAFLAYKPASRGRGVKKISAETEEVVLATWRSNPGFGPGQVRNQLRRQRITVSTRTTRRIMEANGYRVPRKKGQSKDNDEFEATRPLELAQMDILEFFINKAKVYLLLLLDDFSRFLLGWRLVTQTSIDAVIGLVEESIDRYGKMEELLTDRGFVFYSWHGANRFERYLEFAGIDHTHAQAHHPQTLGKVEACNRQLQQELLRQKHFLSLHEAQGAVEHWVKHYNYERTHQGLGGLLVPADRFHGRADQVLSALGEGIDADWQNCYGVDSKIARSIINLVVSAQGTLTVYLLGQPVLVAGGTGERTTQSPRGGHTG